MAPVRAAPDGFIVELDLITGLPGLRRVVGTGEVLLAEEDQPVLHLR